MRVKTYETMSLCDMENWVNYMIGSCQYEDDEILDIKLSSTYLPQLNGIRYIVMIIYK